MANVKGRVGIALAVGLLGFFAFWNWGPSNVRWLPQPSGIHDALSPAPPRFVDEWTSKNGYAPHESITIMSYGQDAWRWEVKLQDGEDLVFHWSGDLLCSVFLDKPVESIFDDPSSECDGLRPKTKPLTATF
jgi:hypothetical protein